MNDYLDYLEHHGVKGMKWGVRKAKDTPAGRYYKNAISESSGVKRKTFKREYKAYKASRNYSIARGKGFDRFEKKANKQSSKKFEKSMKLGKKLPDKNAIGKDAKKYNKMSKKIRNQIDNAAIYKARAENYLNHKNYLRDKVSKMDSLNIKAGKDYSYIYRYSGFTQTTGVQFYTPNGPDRKYTTSVTYVPVYY